MSRVAEDLRRETLAGASGHTAQERLETALRLGDSDVALYRAGGGVSDGAARRRFERQRAKGRRASSSAGGR